MKFDVLRFEIPTTPATYWQVGTDGLLYMDALAIAQIRPELLAEMLARAAEFTEWKRKNVLLTEGGPTRRESK